MFVCSKINVILPNIYIFCHLAFIRGIQIKSLLEKWNEFQLFYFNFKASYFKVEFSFRVTFNSHHHSLMARRPNGTASQEK